MDALKVDNAAVVGHDWGAILAWAVAAALPQRTSMLCVLSVGHPDGFFKHEEGVRQKQMSWCASLLLEVPQRLPPPCPAGLC